MLDQPEYIARYDQHDILGVIASQPEQLKHRFGYAAANPKREIVSIVVAGMGGSALAAEFIKTWLADRLPLPLEIVRGYDLPAYVGPSTLVVVSSYSGNTEETISALEQAEARRAQIVLMDAGGKLAAAAKAERLPSLDLPSGLQPRLAVLFGVRALAEVLEAHGWLDGIVAELEASASWMESHIAGWQGSVPSADNEPKRLAEALVGHPLVIYGGPAIGAVTMKWKIDANENAKHLAFYNYFSEFNHNEFLGWGHPDNANFRVIELRSSFDHAQIKKRFEISNRLLSGDMPDPIVVQAKGETHLEQLIWTLLLGDYTMAYLAFLNQIDPTPVPLIEKLKSDLSRDGDGQ